ncbi:MAG: tRNA pseudouridine(55) synthase TruB [Clostridiales bacterium]|nr:tRNA pseudouridine(55) synthase TruB [Clostridiales bacterium]
MTGFLILDKAQGITSFGALARLRRLTGQKKAGHTGTLDPMATGVLPIALGGATRFIDFLPSDDKAYRAKIRLGLTTDTLDITGKIVNESQVKTDPQEFEAALKQFVGPIEQIPPMYSAVSKDGVRLYKLARQGLEVERKARRVEIYSAVLIGFDLSLNEYEVDIACSAGTYIRTLADDLGRLLGCGASLSALRRTAANGFELKSAHSLEKLEEAENIKDIKDFLIPTDKALAAYPKVRVTEAQALRFKNGGALDLERLAPLKEKKGLFRLYSPRADFLGLGEVDRSLEQMKVRRVFSSK